MAKKKALFTVRQKGPKGRWYVRFSIKGRERELACQGAVTEEDALEIGGNIVVDFARGKFDYLELDKKYPLKDAIKIFEDHSRVHKRSYKSDKSYIKKILNTLGENTDINEITSNTITKFKEKISKKIVSIKTKEIDPQNPKKTVIKINEKETKLKNATINRHIEVLSKMFNLCIKEGWITKNPCEDDTELLEDNYRQRVLEKDEEKRLLTTIQMTREFHWDAENNCEKVVFPYRHLYPIVWCALQTGMRKGEILNLKFSDIDFNEEVIYVLYTKSGKKREIPISKKLKPILRICKNKSKSGYVFANPITEKPYTDIKRSFKSVLGFAKIEDFTFHSIRHTVATRMGENGEDPFTMMEIFGWSSVKIAQRYTHTTRQRKKMAVDKL